MGPKLCFVFLLMQLASGDDLNAQRNNIKEGVSPDACAGSDAQQASRVMLGEKKN